MAERLRKRGSAYEAVLRALVALAASKPKAEEVAVLLEEPDPDPLDLAALDAAWEAEAVTFGPGAQQLQGRADGPHPRRNTSDAARAAVEEIDMQQAINHALFGWYPYLCLIVFLVGSLVRFDREQYTWRTGSSQLLRRRQLMWGSNLFHVGILVIFLGHFGGLLTPVWVFDMLGVSHALKQMMAIVAGGIAGIACFIGLTLLVHRRLFDPRIRKTSSFGDIAILLMLYAQLILGLATIPVSLGHLDGHEMVKFMTWAQGVLTLRPDVADLVCRREHHLQAAPRARHDPVPGVPVHAAGAFLERADLVSRPQGLPGGAHAASAAPRAPRRRGAPAPQRRAGGVTTMTCAVHNAILPKAKGVRVNGVAIPRDEISRETQHHPSKTPAAAWTAAARALVIRELLLQEARRLDVVGEPMSDSDGRRETADEAAIRTLIAREVRTPEPDDATCRRYYEQNAQRFRSADIFEASHILIAADARDTASYAAAREKAAAICNDLHEHPDRFADLARGCSDCPSAAQDGNLGQITAGQTTPEFEQALQRLTPGTITAEPVASRYGFHVIRLERRIAGRAVPFEAAAERIANYLKDSVERLALAQYVARLASAAAIDGVTLADAEALRVH